MLNRLLEKHNEKWSDLIPYVLLKYNSKVHSSTGYFPYIVEGYQNPTQPTDIFNFDLKLTPISQEELEKVHMNVAKKLKLVANKREAKFSKNTKFEVLKKGDKVVVRTGKKKKLSHLDNFPYEGIIEAIIKNIQFKLIETSWSKYH